MFGTSSKDIVKIQLEFIMSWHLWIDLVNKGNEWQVYSKDIIWRKVI